MATKCPPAPIRVFTLILILVISIWTAERQASAETIDLATFFSGHLIATGKFKNFRDGSNRGVKVDIRGGPVGKGFRLTTNTTFSDGEKERKVWGFERISSTRYIGRRTDLVGTASVVVKGRVVSLRYIAKVRASDGKSYNVTFQETFELSKSGHGKNLVKASVFSIPVGEAVLSMRKVSP
jgi:hypothetical protein